MHRNTFHLQLANNRHLIEKLLAFWENAIYFGNNIKTRMKRNFFKSQLLRSKTQWKILVTKIVK